jgi:hypothetical protein
MLALIQAAILALVTLPDGTFAPHFAQHPAGPVARSEHVAQLLVAAGKAHDVDPYLLTALAYHESGFDFAAVSSVGAVGPLQVMPAYWGREPFKLCLRHPIHCEWYLLSGGAKALSHYIAKCNSEARGVTAYRVGACRPVGPRARQVMRLRAAIRAGGVK